MVREGGAGPARPVPADGGGAGGPAAPGDGLTPAQRLAADPGHVAAALAVAARWSRSYPPLADEFESAALVGLVEAATSYDPALGASFKAHLHRRVAGAVRDCCRLWAPKGYRRAYRRAGEVPAVLNRAVSRCDGDGRRDEYQEDVPAGELPVGWGSDALDGVDELTRGLPPRHREVVRLLYCRADTAAGKAAARVLGLSESRVSQIHTAALAMIRENLGVTA